MNHQSNPAVRMPVAGLLTWLLPGAGHLFIGERVRGVIFMTAIAVTFWGGVAIGGVKNTVNPVERSLWFAGQICAGGHTLAAVAISRMMADPPASDPSLRVGYGPSEEIPVVYTAICGMLNILIIFDVLVRSERQAAFAVAGRAPPGAAGRAPR